MLLLSIIIYHIIPVCNSYECTHSLTYNSFTKHTRDNSLKLHSCRSFFKSATRVNWMSNNVPVALRVCESQLNAVTVTLRQLISSFYLSSSLQLATMSFHKSVHHEDRSEVKTEETKKLRSLIISQKVKRNWISFCFAISLCEFRG